MPPPTEAAEQKEECSIANLSGGFKLAWDLFDELNPYESGHPSRCDKSEMDVRFDSLGKKFYARRKNVSGKKALVEGGKRIWCGHGDSNPNARKHENLKVLSPQ